MIQPWCERQREALRAFRQAITARAQREREVAEGARSRQQSAEQRYGAERARVEGDFAGAQADSLTRAEQSRQTTQERQQRERDKLQREHRKGKEKLQQEYLDAKVKLETEFREGRWTTNTVFEADKRVAKEQMLEAVSACKNLLRKLLSDWRVGRALLMKLEFLDDVPDLDPKEINITESDPWARMQQCADQTQADLHALQTMRSPRFINGRLPWLVLVAGWLVLSAPALILFLWLPDWWFAAGWLAAATIVLPIGYWYVNRERRRTNDRIIALWLSLRHSAHLARLLRPVCLRLVKKAYLTKKRQSYKRNRDLLRAIVVSTRTKLHDLRIDRDKLQES